MRASEWVEFRHGAYVYEGRICFDKGYIVVLVLMSAMFLMYLITE